MAHINIKYMINKRKLSPKNMLDSAERYDRQTPPGLIVLHGGIGLRRSKQSLQKWDNKLVVDNCDVAIRMQHVDEYKAQAT